MMKHSFRVQLSFLFFCLLFIVGVIIPRPSLRVESIRFQSNAEVILVGSSIIDHTPNASVKSLRNEIVLKTRGEVAVAGKAGMTPEEVDFILSKFQGRDVHIVLGLYALLSPETYGKSKYLYYNSSFEGLFIERLLWFNPKKAADKKSGRDKYESIKEQVTNKVRMLGASGARYKFDDIDIQHFKYSYWGDFEETSALIKRNLERLTRNGRQVLFVLPEMNWLDNKSKYYIEQIVDLVSKNKDSKIITLEYEQLSEPWCLCGHLGLEGIEKVTTQLLAKEETDA